jgi:hypothetical protein
MLNDSRYKKAGISSLINWVQILSHGINFNWIVFCFWLSGVSLKLHELFAEDSIPEYFALEKSVFQDMWLATQ